MVCFADQESIWRAFGVQVNNIFEQTWKCDECVVKFGLDFHVRLFSP